MGTGQVSLTQGSVAKGMLAFAIPIFFSNLFQQLYNAADSLIVGNFLGESALAAVGSSGSLINLLTGFVNGVSLGAGIVVARYFGAKDGENLRKVIHTTMALGLVAGTALTVVGVAFTPQILRWMGTPDNVIGQSILYFRIYFMGCIAVVLYNVEASILQSLGDSRSPMCYLITASLVNVVLDLLFVAGFGMGVGSAAFATILSQILSAVLAFRKLSRAPAPCAVNWREIRFHGAALGAVIRQGLPTGTQNSVTSLANVIVQANINTFGSQAMAGCAAYVKVEGFTFLPVICFGMAIATFVSQNVGARQIDRMRRGMRFGVVMAVILAETLSMTLFFVAPWVIGAFNSQPEVIAYGVRFARIVSPFYFLAAFSQCAAGILVGLGRPMVPMTILLALWCGLRIGYIVVAVPFLQSIEVIYWAFPLTWAASSLVFAFYLLHTTLPNWGDAPEKLIRLGRRGQLETEKS